MSDSAEKDASWCCCDVMPTRDCVVHGEWTETPLGYEVQPGRVLMCRGESSCDEKYYGEDGICYYCRRLPGHPTSVGHDCPADSEARAHVMASAKGGAS